MTEMTSLESFNAARFALRSWEPENSSSEQLKGQMLEFLEIVEKERDRLQDYCEAQNVERRQLEMALCHTEDAISITTIDGTIRMVNPAFEKLTGYRGEEMVGQNHHKFWSASDMDKVEKMKTLVLSGCDWRGDLTICSREGEPYDVQTSVVPIIRPTGEIVHCVYTLHDITQRSKLQKSIHLQKQFLEKVINLNPSLIIILDDNGKWMLDNLAAKTLISDLGSGARKKLATRILSRIRGHKKYKPEKLLVNMPNGRDLSFMMYCEEIPAKYLMPDSDKTMAYIITLSDITSNEKNYQENLVRQKALLASRIEKNMIQGEFINGFIYHLQKPLNISKAAIARVQTAVNANRFDQVEQATLLMRQELEFLEGELTKYRIIPQTQTDEKESTVSTELTAAIKVLYQEQYQTEEIEILDNSNGVACYPLPYEGMQLMLKILIDNALESIHEHGDKFKVRIKFSSGMGGSLLCVEDSGGGIEKGDRNKVFEPFFTTKQNHSGLSLTILHQLVNNIRGHVELSDSNLGGVKMTLYFPGELL